MNIISQIIVVTAMSAGVVTASATELFYDEFQEQNVNGLNSSWDIRQGAGNVYVDEEVAVINHSNARGRVLATTDNQLVNGEAAAQFTWLEGPPTTGYTDVGLVLRSNSSADSYYVCRLRAGSSGTARVVIERRLAGETEKFTNVLLGSTISEGSSFRMKCAVVKDQIKAKVWSASASEPSTWTVTVTDVGSPIVTTGEAGFRSSAGSDFSGPGIITMDNYSVTDCAEANEGCTGITSPSPPRIEMYAIPSEGIPAACQAGYYSVLMYCSGDCSNDDARVRFCAKN